MHYESIDELIDNLTDKILNWKIIYPIINSYEVNFKKDLEEYCKLFKLDINDFNKPFKHVFTKMYQHDCPLNF